MASAIGAGTPRRVRRVSVSIGSPVRARWASVSFRACSTSGAGTGTAGADTGAAAGAGSGFGELLGSRGDFGLDGRGCRRFGLLDRGRCRFGSGLRGVRGWVPWARPGEPACSVASCG